MGSKYTRKKHGKSHYKERLEARGLHSAPTMPTREALLKKHEAQERRDEKSER